MSSIIESYAAHTPKESSDLEERREAHRAQLRASRERTRRMGKRGMIGALAVATVIAGAKFGPAGWRSFDRTVAAAQDAQRQDAMVYGGKFKIPSETDPRDVLLAGHEYDGITLVNVTSVADYVHEQNPAISKSEVADLVEAENTQVQRHEGVPEDKIDPTLLASGPILLPPQYEVGEFMPGDNNHG